MRTEKEREEDFEENFDDIYDVLKYVADVKSKENKENLTSDYTLAKLGEQDKSGIIEMAQNAYKTRIAILKTIKYCQNQQQINEIKEHANNIFNMIMQKCNLTVILNRNVPNNYLVKILAKKQENEDQTENTTTEATLQAMKINNQGEQK